MDYTLPSDGLATGALAQGFAFTRSTQAGTIFAADL